MYVKYKVYKPNLRYILKKVFFSIFLLTWRQDRWGNSLDLGARAVRGQHRLHLVDGGSRPHVGASSSGGGAVGPQLPATMTITPFHPITQLRLFRKGFKQLRLQRWAGVHFLWGGGYRVRASPVNFGGRGGGGGKTVGAAGGGGWCGDEAGWGGGWCGVTVSSVCASAFAVRVGGLRKQGRKRNYRKKEEKRNLFPSSNVLQLWVQLHNYHQCTTCVPLAYVI